MILALRLVGALLLAASALSAVGTVGMVIGIAREGGSMGLATPLLSGLVQSVWQGLAGAALALLCLVAARRLERPVPPPGAGGAGA